MRLGEAEDLWSLPVPHASVHMSCISTLSSSGYARLVHSCGLNYQGVLPAIYGMLMLETQAVVVLFGVRSLKRCRRQLFV